MGRSEWRQHRWVINNLKKQKRNEDPDRSVITIVTGKTKAQVTIPVHPWIVEIASDYSAMQLPLAGSSQKFNQQLRRIALESGLFDGALADHWNAAQK